LSVYLNPARPEMLLRQAPWDSLFFRRRSVVASKRRNTGKSGLSGHECQRSHRGVESLLSPRATLCRSLVGAKEHNSR